MKGRLTLAQMKALFEEATKVSEEEQLAWANEQLARAQKMFKRKYKAKFTKR